MTYRGSGYHIDSYDFKYKIDSFIIDIFKQVSRNMESTILIFCEERGTTDSVLKEINFTNQPVFPIYIKTITCIVEVNCNCVMYMSGPHM